MGHHDRHHRVPWTPPRRGEKWTQRSPATAALFHCLGLVDPDRILKVRKVSELGPDGFTALHEHCEAYGRVGDILAMQPQEQQMQLSRRMKLCSQLTFVVMADVASAEAVLAAGRDQEVMGQSVAFERYVHRSVKCGQGPSGAVDQMRPAKGRGAAYAAGGTSSASTASTASAPESPRAGTDPTDGANFERRVCSIRIGDGDEGGISLLFS